MPIFFESTSTYLDFKSWIQNNNFPKEETSSFDLNWDKLNSLYAYADKKRFLSDKKYEIFLEIFLI